MHDIARAAADAARLPDFADLQRRGDRRRNVRNGVTAGAAALVVASIIGIGQLVGGDGGQEIEPAPSPSVPTTPQDDLGQGGPAALAVDDPAAVISDAAVLDDGSVATVWAVGERETGLRTGLAVVGGSDPWARNYPIPQEVYAADDRFLVRDETMSRLQVLTPSDHELQDVAVDGGASPVADGEVPVAMSDGLLAVDPATATAHPVPLPDGLYDIDVHGGRLSAVSTAVTGGEFDEATYHWSDDGGARWESATFEAAWDSDVQIVPTDAGTDHVLAIVTKAAANRPLGSVLTMPAEGGGFAETAYDGELATIAGAFVVDGEIRFLGDLWGSGSSPRESGLYRWADGALELIAAGADVTGREDAAVLDVAAGSDAPVVLLGDGSALFRSVDGGTSWEQVTAR